MPFQKVPPGEQLLVSTYEDICRELQSKRLLYTDTFHLPEVLLEARDRGGAVVVATKDASVCLQETNHPNADLYKYAMCGVEWEKLAAARDSYYTLKIGPACKSEMCDKTHRYSVKTERYTWGTFAEVPENTRVYTVNLGVRHKAMTLLPFGMNDDGDGWRILQEYTPPEKKRGWLYVNFRDNTLDRLSLNQFWMGASPALSWSTFRGENCPSYLQYVEELAAHRFTLAPLGNGYDSYRVWEALYLGTIPVLPDCYFARQLAEYGLPVLVAPALAPLPLDYLEEAWANLQNREWNLRMATRSFWKKELEGALRDVEKS